MARKKSLLEQHEIEERDRKLEEKLVHQQEQGTNVTCRKASGDAATAVTELDTIKTISSTVLSSDNHNVYIRFNSLEAANGELMNNLNPQKYLFSENNRPINYGSCETKNKEQQYVDNYLTPSSDANYNYNKLNNYHYNDKNNSNSFGADGEPEDSNTISVSDIVGSFGWFQFLILLFSGLREGSVGYDAVVMSLILRPTNDFYCADQLKTEDGSINLSSFSGNSNEFNETSQCFQSIDAHMLMDPSTQSPIKCESWIFEDPNSLMAEWTLVCGRHWLIAFIESAYFMGLVTGNLVWGYYADRVGRRKAYLLAHSIALVFGWLSVFAPNIWLFSSCRFFTAFGSISYNIIYSIQVELIGTKHRSFSTLLNHLGWGLGVIAVPLVNALFSDRYRIMIALAPLLTLIMFPWAFWLPESSRWLMAKDKFAKARQELIRAARFNGKQVNPILERKISLLRQKVKCEQLKQQEQDSNRRGADKHLYKMLFTNKTYVRDTLILSYISFTGHLFYYMLTINFGYIKNLSIEANFISSGAGEWVSVLVGAILLKFTSRKFCLSLFLSLMAGSFIFQFLIDYQVSTILESEFIVSLNNAIGTLSALLVIFVSLIVNQEVYPTIIRQTGSSIVNTVAESGSTLAPLLIQVSRFIGPTSADWVYALISLFGIFCVQFLTKTDDIDLPDT